MIYNILLMATVYFFIGLTVVLATLSWLEYRKLTKLLSKPCVPERRDESSGVMILEQDRWGELDEHLIDNETPESRKQAMLFEKTLPPIDH